MSRTTKQASPTSEAVVVTAITATAALLTAWAQVVEAQANNLNSVHVCDTIGLVNESK